MPIRNSYIALSLLISMSWLSHAQISDPIANTGAVVLSGNARFTILTDHVIRMEYSRSGSFTDDASLTFINRHLDVPTFKTSEDKDWLIIQSRYSTVYYHKNSGPFSDKNLHIDYKDSIHTFTWKPGMKDDKNLKGTTRTLDGDLGKTNFIGTKNIPMEDGIISRSGWAVVDDSGNPTFDHSDWPWVQERNDHGGQDIYFFGYGSDYKAVMYDFTLIAGKMSLPPRYAFGVWYSRYWAYTEQDFKDIVEGYHKNNIPLDVLVIDMDWHMTDHSSPEIFKHYHPKPNGWTGFTWEKKYFPDYKEFLSWTDTQHLQTCMNLHPAAGVQQHEEMYPVFAKAMGIDPISHQTIKFNITDKKFAQNYFDLLLHPYEKAGVDFWWLDWQQQNGTKIKGVNSTFYLNYVHFSDMQRQGKRPLIFHRWGGLGNLRYQIGFSGDYFINWKSLDYQPEFTATAANVGFGFWSHDIGGHMNFISKTDKQDAELFTRWVEWGAYSPIFRTHATNDGEIERRMWMYPEPNLIAMRKALLNRSALLPYIYTMARFAFDSGLSIVHPMYYEYPNLEKTYHLEHQFYFGNNMIASPVTSPMGGKESISQTVWLPDGKWYDFRNNNQIIGGGDFVGNYAVDEIPVFIKAGSIIPMQTAKLRITGSVFDTLVLAVYTGQSGSFDMYEDEGNTEGYRNGIFSFTHMSWLENNGRQTLKVEPDGKTFPGQLKERSYEIKIISAQKPSQIMLNGQNMDWSYDEKSKTLMIKVPRQPIAPMTLNIL